ncbi:MAG: PAS domain S-box protein [Candidatus Hodarchaeales archaeon]|jgi:PAS domain S-box-containing protein
MSFKELLHSISSDIRPQIQSLLQEIGTYKLLVDKLNEGVLLEDDQGLITFANPRVEEILGYTEKELLGKHWDFLFPSEELDKLTSTTSKRSDGTSSSYETSLLTKEGQRIPIILSVTPVVQGEYKRVLSIFTDIMGLRKAEDSLKRSENRYRLLLELFPDATTITDLDATILMANKQTMHMYGYDHMDDILGKSIYDLIAPVDHLLALMNIKETLEEGIVTNTEYQMIRKDGSLFPAELSVTYIADDIGEPMNYMAVIRDITIRKKAQEERKQLEERRNDFIEKTAHELRTPLTVIRGFAEILKKQEKGDKRKHYLNLILKNVERLENLASEVSDVFQIDRGMLNVALTNLELNKFLTSFLEPYNKLHEGQFRWIDKHSDKYVIIKGDSGRLTTALENIFDNAIRYTSKKDRDITLELVTSETEINIIISDNGVGVNPSNLERIFEKFVSFSVNGAGIGLYIAREIIGAHNGSIKASSKGKDTGTTITISLPRIEN